MDLDWEKYWVTAPCLPLLQATGPCNAFHVQVSHQLNSVALNEYEAKEHKVNDLTSTTSE